MTHIEKRQFLLRYLLSEQPHYRDIAVPTDDKEQKALLRALMNVRVASPVSEDFIAVQDAYLRETIAERGITEIDDLSPVANRLYLWQGDITTLRCGAIVNAANSGMTGCYAPGHLCIDNCIHTFAGVQLRQYCADMIKKQGFEEPTGSAKITPAFNLPCKSVIHTVGPVVRGVLTEQHKTQLESCYRACLALAAENECGSIAFCCISTGAFGFPQREAAQIAVRTVRAYLNETDNDLRVVFNVFTTEDKRIYASVLAMGS